MTQEMMKQNMESNTGAMMASAVSKVIEAVLPGLAEKGSKEEMVQHMEKVLKWIEMMPETLRPEDKWSREEFKAVMMGPVESEDPSMADYMDDFYEKYSHTSQDEHQDFYMKLFQNEQQISDVDWLTLWGNVRDSYEHGRKMDEDLWLSGGEKTN